MHLIPGHSDFVIVDKIQGSLCTKISLLFKELYALKTNLEHSQRCCLQISDCFVILILHHESVNPF